MLAIYDSICRVGTAIVLLIALRVFDVLGIMSMLTAPVRLALDNMKLWRLIPVVFKGWLGQWINCVRFYHYLLSLVDIWVPLSILCLLLYFMGVSGELYLRSGRRFRSWLFTAIVDRFSTLSPDTMRTKFRSIQIADRMASNNNHSHRDAAADRVNMNNAIDNLLQSCGYDVYSISMSSRDERKNFSGTRAYFTAKDSSKASRFDTLPESAAIKLSDVDYYIEDMADVLSYNRPVILYTFDPLVAAGPVADGRFKVNSDNTIQLNVIGDAEYKHQLWDYSSDHLVVDTWCGSYVYLVETIPHPIDESRRIVGLFPARFIAGPIGWLMPGKRLTRRKLVHRGFSVNRFLYKENVGTEEYISFAYLGESYSATMPVSVCQAYYEKFKRSKVAPIATIEGNIRTMCAMTVSSKDQTVARPFWKKVADPQSDAFLLMNVFERAPELVFQQLTPMSLPTYKAAAEDHRYSCHTSNTLLSEEPAESLRAVAKPLAHSAASPDASPTGDEVTIRDRLVAQRNFVRVHPNDKMHARASWFIRKMVGDQMHLGVPVDVDDVHERQGRPTQRTIFFRFVFWLANLAAHSKATISSFMKREAYGKRTAPRNISTIPGTLKLSYSRFIYALSDSIMHHMPWYAFSKTPVDIAHRVAGIVGAAKTITPTDFSKFDGTHGKFLCEKELELLLAFFAPEYHDEVTTLYWSQYNTVGYTAFGSKYKTWLSRLSGSPETSTFNSFDNALTAFLTICESCTDNEEGYEKAWASLGLYGGDDGITPDVNTNTYEKVAAKLGLKLKAETLVAPQPVPFLSRLYTEAWTGGCGSITEPLRQIQKFHLTHASADCPTALVLTRKACSYLLTDPETPLLKDISEAIIRICPVVTANDGQEEVLKQDLSWFSQYDRSEQFPPPEDIDATRALVAELVCVNITELDAAISKIQKAETLDEVFFGTVFGVPIKTEVAVAAGLDLLRPEPPVANNDDTQAIADLAIVIEAEKRRAAAEKKLVEQLKRTPKASPNRASLEEELKTVKDLHVDVPMPPAPVTPKEAPPKKLVPKRTTPRKPKERKTPKEKSVETPLKTPKIE